MINGEKTVSSETVLPGGFKPKWTWRMFGSAAPVFPGFEVDICDRVPDAEKPDAVWHRERAREMLQAHPEIKQLFGYYPLTAVWCVLMAGIQLGIAAAMSHFPWWVAILTAYCVGALLNITLFQLAHECDHLNVFRSKFWNRYLFMVTSIPMFLSAHHTWWIEHIVRHERDEGLHDTSPILLSRDSPDIPFVCPLFPVHGCDAGDAKRFWASFILLHFAAAWPP